MGRGGWWGLGSGSGRNAARSLDPGHSPGPDCVRTPESFPSRNGIVHGHTLGTTRMSECPGQSLDLWLKLISVNRGRGLELGLMLLSLGSGLLPGLGIRSDPDFGLIGRRTSNHRKGYEKKVYPEQLALGLKKTQKSILRIPTIAMISSTEARVEVAVAVESPRNGYLRIGRGYLRPGSVLDPIPSTSFLLPDLPE